MMHICKRAAGLKAAVLVLLAAAAVLAWPGQVTKPYVELVRNSGFIFVGTVKRLNAATPTVVRERNTVVVTVERNVEALPPVGDMKGKDVTVRLGLREKVDDGQRVTFFTYLYSAGASLGLQSVGMLPADDESASKDRVRAARQVIADEALSKRLSSATLVVLGRVVDAGPAQGTREREGEHDPMWWRATIAVEAALKGRVDSGTVTAIFASSDDRGWFMSPKPKRGDIGIYLLQPGRGKQFTVKGLYLIDPLDALDRSELDRVRRLLNLIR
jgi:hypothetical protein